MKDTVDNIFDIVHPRIDWSVGGIGKFINMHFILETRRDAMPRGGVDRPTIQLRGEERPMTTFISTCKLITKWL